LDRLRTIAAALKHRGEIIRKIVNEAMIRTMVNEAGIEVGETNLDGVLIKGHLCGPLALGDAHSSFQLGGCSAL
jgi:hypothetical protein